MQNVWGSHLLNHQGQSSPQSFVMILLIDLILSLHEGSCTVNYFYSYIKSIRCLPLGVVGDLLMASGGVLHGVYFCRSNASSVPYTNERWSACWGGICCYQYLYHYSSCRFLQNLNSIYLRHDLLPDLNHHWWIANSNFYFDNPFVPERTKSLCSHVYRKPHKLVLFLRTK